MTTKEKPILKVNVSAKIENIKEAQELLSDIEVLAEKYDLSIDLYSPQDNQDIRISQEF